MVWIHGGRFYMGSGNTNLHGPDHLMSEDVVLVTINYRLGALGQFNPLNPELNPICYLLTLLVAHHFLHVSRIRVKSLTIRLLISYIWSTHS